MTGYIEKRQLEFPLRTALPLPLVMEAGAELLMLCTIVAGITALEIVPLSWSGVTVAGLGYTAVGLLLAAGLSRHAPHDRFGVANAITLCRLALSILLMAVTAEELMGESRLLDTTFRWGLTAAAVTSLLLDGVDGWAARRSQMTSEFGARFDMETDAFFLLSLTLLLTAGGIVGPWVIASGAIYYLFRLASRYWPHLNAPLYPSLRRKTICAVQGALLIAALVPAMPDWGAQLSCLTGLTLLLYSFGADVIWLTSRRR